MLTLKDTQSLVTEVKKILIEEAIVTEIPVGIYEKMQYPKHIPFFRFEVKAFLIENFGNVMVMETKAFGVMHLVTLSFTPNLGTNIPFLLIDCMSVRKKRTIFVEYYDCTVVKQAPEELRKLAKKYEHLPDYPEKDAWYVPLRSSYSLVKGNTPKEEPELIELLLSEIRTYTKLSQQRQEKSVENISRLKAFRERMISDGNPSSAILSKVLGKEGAKEFYRRFVIPVNEIGRVRIR